MLEISQLSARFEDLQIFDQFSLSVPKHRFTVLIGPSGCGKSTLFNVLTGVIPKESGTISWNGSARPHLDRMAVYMPQKDLLLPWLSLLDNTLLPARIAGPVKPDSVDRAKALFRRLGIDGFEDYLPKAISGGMRQRCALVRTLMFDRDLVLLDEPLSALDAITRSSLQDLLLLLQAEFGKTILMITHDIEEALLLADELIVLSRRPMAILQHLDLSDPKPRRIDDPDLVRTRAQIRVRLRRELDDAP